MCLIYIRIKENLLGKLNTELWAKYCTFSLYSLAGDPACGWWWWKRCTAAAAAAEEEEAEVGGETALGGW